MLTVLCLAVMTAPDADTHLLRHRFEAGQSSVVRIDHASAIDLRAPDGEQQIKHSSTTVRRAEVERVTADGSGVIVLTIERTRMEADAPDTEKVVYDSQTDAETPEMFVGVAGTIGKPLLRMTVTPTGEVTKVEEMQGSAESAASAEAAESVMHSNMQPYIPLPEEPIEVGGKWKDVYKVNLRDESGFPVPVKMQRTFKLESVTAGVAEVSWRTVTVTPLSDPKLQSQVMKREVSGTLAFDTAEGRMTQRTTEGNRTVVGFAGAGTSMRTVSKRSEKIVEAVASAEAPAVK